MNTGLPAALQKLLNKAQQFKKENKKLLTSAAKQIGRAHV
jgi:hypothetical protein